MLCDGYTKVWDLAPGEIVRLDDARGATLRVTRGTLWITLQDDTRDVVLEAGDVFTIDRAGLTIVEAQGAAGVCVLGHTVDEQRWVPAVSNWRERPAPWLQTLAAARRWAPYF